MPSVIGRLLLSSSSSTRRRRRPRKSFFYLLPRTGGGGGGRGLGQQTTDRPRVLFNPPPATTSHQPSKTPVRRGPNCPAGHVRRGDGFRCTYEGLATSLPLRQPRAAIVWRHDELQNYRTSCLIDAGASTAMAPGLLWAAGFYFGFSWADRPLPGWVAQLPRVSSGLIAGPVAFHCGLK